VEPFTHRGHADTTPDKVKSKPISLAQRQGADALVVITFAYDYVSRPRSYELSAKEFGLNG